MAYWSDLPPELLDLVATHFDTQSDTRHFRSVCTTWRLAVPRLVQAKFSPIKFLNSNLHHCDLLVTKHAFFHLSLPWQPDSLGWLIKTEEHEPGSIYLFNPFSRASIKQLPLNFPKNLDLTNVRVHELGCEYVLRNISGNMELYNMEHEKVALIITTSLITYPNVSENVNDYVVLSTHNTGKLLMYRSKLQAWEFLDDPKLGYDDRSIFVNDWSLHYVDVIEFNGTFYAVTNSGRTVSIKVTGHNVIVTLLKKSIIGGDKKCLVKLADDLLMVDLYTDTTPGLVKVLAVEIFKLDEEKWVLIKSLEDYTLFLSNHSSFSAVGLQGFKGNCIYFRFKNNLDKDYQCCSGSKEDECEEFAWKNDEIGVFDFDKGIVGSLEDYMEDSVVFSWPPPAWVTST